MFPISRRWLILVVLAAVPLSGCLFRTRRVESNLTPLTLKSATKPELVSYINSQAAKIQTMQATVDIDTSVGGVKKGKVTEYKEIRGYVLARKPAMLRMIGLMPIIRNTAFDMVSDGQEFKVSIPAKNRFVIGRNDLVTHNAQQPLENLRPKIIYDALLLREIDDKEWPVFKNDSVPVVERAHRFDQPIYIIDVIAQHDNQRWLSREIIFSRINLLPERQLIYDEGGTVVTDVHYREYKDFNAILFPSIIQIHRPEEEYDLTLHIVKLEMNLPLANEKFVLEKPPGAQVIRLEQQQPQSSGGGNTGEASRRSDDPSRTATTANQRRGNN
ncbi:MAG TPA: hypothetical protein VM711_04675 [Sphingomicrobium sp.]|nr:hypothetical protein [Sphingomicrobium sp.]